MKVNRLLLIVPKFFSYEIYIRNELIKLGFYVDLVYENIDEFSIKYKLQKKIGIDKTSYFNRYYWKKIYNKQYDFVLVIRGSTLTTDLMEDMIKFYPNAKFYLYQWDSVKNNSNTINISRYFDKVSTFDPKDAYKYGWDYRPLFFVKSCERNKKRNIDIAFICTLHSKRARIYKLLKKYNYKKYIYVYSKLSHFIKERFLNKNHDYVDMSLFDIKFISISLKQLNTIMSNTNIIVDYTHPNQTGFTMRICEAIGNRCKIVTNNKLIKEADFYNENNIYIYDEDNFMIPENFMKTPYFELSQDVYNKYKLSSWIKDIINYE